MDNNQLNPNYYIRCNKWVSILRKDGMEQLWRLKGVSCPFSSRQLVSELFGSKSQTKKMGWVRGFNFPTLGQEWDCLISLGIYYSSSNSNPLLAALHLVYPPFSTFKRSQRIRVLSWWRGTYSSELVDRDSFLSLSDSVEEQITQAGQHATLWRITVWGQRWGGRQEPENFDLLLLLEHRCLHPRLPHWAIWSIPVIPAFTSVLRSLKLYSLAFCCSWLLFLAAF